MSSAKLSRNFPFALQPELVLKTADSRYECCCAAVGAGCGSGLGAAESVNSALQNTQRNFPLPMSRHSPPQDLHSTVCLLNRFALSTQAIFLCRRFERTTLRVRKPFPNLRFSTSFRPFQLRAMPTVLPPCPTAQLCPNR